MKHISKYNGKINFNFFIVFLFSFFEKKKYMFNKLLRLLSNITYIFICV